MIFYHQKLKTDLHVTCDPLPTPPELVFDVTWSIYLVYGDVCPPVAIELSWCKLTVNIRYNRGKQTVTKID